MIEVVAGFVRREGRFLICRRPQGKNCAGQWEFAGGKVEAGETGAEALRREWREELGMELEVGEVLAETTHDYPAVTVHLTLYAAASQAKAPERREHSAIRWIRPDEIDGYSFCPADAKLIAALRERGIVE